MSSWLEARYTMDHDDPAVVKRHIDVGNYATASTSPEQGLWFAMIEELYSTAIGHSADSKRLCRITGCNSKHSNQACALAYIASSDFENLCDLLGNGISAEYFRRLLQQAGVDGYSVKRQYRKSEFNKKLVRYKPRRVIDESQAQTIENRSDPGLPGQT